MFLQKDTSSYQPGLLKKCQKAQIQCIPQFSCQKTVLSFTLPEADQIHKNLLIQFRFSSGRQGFIIETKFTNSCEFSPFRIKLIYHMFTSLKMEEYMKSVLFGSFQVKLVSKNIVMTSGFYFMHMWVKLRVIQSKVDFSLI